MVGELRGRGAARLLPQPSELIFLQGMSESDATSSRSGGGGCGGTQGAGPGSGERWCYALSCSRWPCHSLGLVRPSQGPQNHSSPCSEVSGPSPPRRPSLAPPPPEFFSPALRTYCTLSLFGFRLSGSRLSPQNPDQCLGPRRCQWCWVDEWTCLYMELARALTRAKHLQEAQSQRSPCPSCAYPSLTETWGRGGPGEAPCSSPAPPAPPHSLRPPSAFRPSTREVRTPLSVAERLRGWSLLSDLT